MSVIGSWCAYVSYGWLYLNGFIGWLYVILYFIPLASALPIAFLMFYVNADDYRLTLLSYIIFFYVLGGLVVTAQFGFAIAYFILKAPYW